VSDDPYKVLQVDPEADPEVIQAAYRRLAQKYHPDTAAIAGGSRMAALNQAWEVLRDPVRRAAHDRARAAAEVARRPGPGTASPGPGSASPAPGPSSRGPDDAAPPGGGWPPGTPPRQPETVSRDWTSGRSSVGGGYDPSTMGAPQGFGAAGPAPGNPSGSTLNFGRYAGWSLGEIARSDLEYIEWLDRIPIGRQYREEVDAILRRTGRRRSAQADATERRGLFRRR